MEKAESFRDMIDSGIFFYYLSHRYYLVSAQVRLFNVIWPKHNPLSHVEFSSFKAIWENTHLSPVDQENAPEEDK